jgi:ferredoxin
MALAETLLEGLGYGSGRLALIEEQDPEALAATLARPADHAAPTAGDFLVLGGKRSRSLFVLRHLHQQAPQPTDLVALPRGAPFGNLQIDRAACTLCLACVGACPTGALADNPDRPWLGFKEEACIQCGLCRVTCPESALALEPRFNFTETAGQPRELKGERPFHCIRCGKPFGVGSTVRHIAARLGGTHGLFAQAAQQERLFMCDDCRVVVQFERPDDPFAGPARPRPRTTDDDLREREIQETRARLKRDYAEEHGKDQEPER